LKLLLLTGLAIAFASAALAQGSGSTASGGNSSATATGCLTKSASLHSLILTNVKYPKGVRVQSSKDLSAGIGHMVTLTGFWGMYPASSSGGTMDIGSGGKISTTNMIHDFTSAKITHVGDACTAGGTVKKATDKPAVAPDNASGNTGNGKATTGPNRGFGPRENRDWADADAKGTAEAYAAFLKRYPNTSHLRVVTGRVDGGMGLDNSRIVCSVEVNGTEHYRLSCSDALRFGIMEGSLDDIGSAPPHDATVFLKNDGGTWEIVAVTSVSVDAK